MTPIRSAAVVATLLALAGCRHSRVETVESFRAAHKAGDLDTARACLSDDPRVRYDERAGDGDPWKLGAGKWKAWDTHFNSEGELGPWHVDGDAVWAIASEMNDYFRLIEREDQPQYRLTYFFDHADRIEGYLISAAHADKPKPPSMSRFDEIEAWATLHHRDEWDYLRPGGRLDPTGDRAPRTRALINQWRAEQGLAPID